MAESAWRRALVTGAGGFIGGHMVRFLRGIGVETVAVDRSSGPDKAPVDERMDLATPGSLDRLLDGRTVVFHLAGSADVRASVSTPADDFRDNVLPTLHVLESARRVGAAVLFPSTGSVYDPAAAMPVAEEASIRPSSPYAAAKAAGEAYCFAYHRSYGLDVRVARMFSIYGPGMRRFAIHDFFQRLRRDPSELVIRGDGGQTRDYLYVQDTVEALYRVMWFGTPGTVYNVAGGRALSMLEVARAVAGEMGLPASRVFPDGEVFKAEVYRMEADVSRLADIGFVPSVEFGKGIARTIAWFRDPSRG